MHVWRICHCSVTEIQILTYFGCKFDTGHMTMDALLNKWQITSMTSSLNADVSLPFMSPWRPQSMIDGMVLQRVRFPIHHGSNSVCKHVLCIYCLLARQSNSTEDLCSLFMNKYIFLTCANYCSLHLKSCKRKLIWITSSEVQITEVPISPI